MEQFTPYTDSINNNTICDTETRWFDIENPLSRVASSWSYINNVDSATWNGQKLKDYNLRKKRGDLLPFTSWSRFGIKGTTGGSYRFRTGDSDYWSEWYVNDHGHASTTIWVPSLEDMSEIANMYATDKFVQLAAAAIYTEKRYDVSTALVELGETAEMFKSVAKSFLKWHRTLGKRAIARNKGDFSEITLGEIADAWLAGRYGWRTLYYDMLSLAETIKTYNVKRKKRLSERKGTHLSYRTFETIVDHPEDYYDLVHQVTNTYRVGLNGHVIADIELAKLYANAVQTAWEATKLSFMIDWLFTIGKTISAASMALNASKYEASMGCYVKNERVVVSSSTNYRGRYISGSRQHIATCTGVLKLRSPCSIPYSPFLTCRLDPFKILDILSVLTQQIRR